MLCGEYDARFEDTSVLPVLNLLPDAVVSSQHKDSADAWMESVINALKLYSEFLPSEMTLKTELRGWRNYWSVPQLFDFNAVLA